MSTAGHRGGGTQGASGSFLSRNFYLQLIQPHFPVFGRDAWKLEIFKCGFPRFRVSPRRCSSEAQAKRTTGKEILLWPMEAKGAFQNEGIGCCTTLQRSQVEVDLGLELRGKSLGQTLKGGLAFLPISLSKCYRQPSL